MHTHSGSLELSCVSCVAGKFKTVPGPSSCTDCPAGKYATSTGNDKAGCLSCVAGKYSSAFSATTFSTCTDCEAGKYSSDVGASECTKCAAGTFSASWGATSETTCIDCPADTYSAAEAARSPDACVGCPAGKTSAHGSMVEADCVSVASSSTTPSSAEPVLTIAAAPAHFVRVVLSLSLSTAAFTSEKQAKFRQAIAAAAGVSSTDVEIETIKDVTSKATRYPLP